MVSALISWLRSCSCVMSGHKAGSFTTSGHIACIHVRCTWSGVALPRQFQSVRPTKWLATLIGIAAASLITSLSRVGSKVLLPPM